MVIICCFNQWYFVRPNRGRWVELAFIIVFVSSAVVVVGASNTDPAPTLESVDVPNEVTLGESFTITVEATNIGGPAGSYSTITLSSPTLDSQSDEGQGSLTDHNLDYGTVKGPGETIYTKSGNQITADYVLVEAGTTESNQWGSERSITVEFTPEETGSFLINVRSTLTDDDSSDQFTAPSQSTTSDQQRYSVEQYEVDVREEADIDARFVDTTVDNGEYERGDTVDATVTVENTGNREHTFFVGYSVIDENGQKYDNDNSTGRPITLDVGEQRTVDLSWKVEDDAPKGTYDIVTAVWKESDRTQLETRKANKRIDGAFRLQPVQEVSFEVSKKSSIEGYEFSGDPIHGATVSVGGETKTTDSDGKVTFALPTGAQSYTVGAEGYETAEDTLDVTEDAGLQLVSVPLVKDGVGVVSLSVVDSSGQELGGNEYTVLVDGETHNLNENGDLLLQAGERTVTIEPTDFGRENGVTRTNRRITVSEGEQTDLTIRPVAKKVDSVETLSVEVLRVNGKKANTDGVYDLRAGGVDSVTIKITDDSGNPVQTLSPRLVALADGVTFEVKNSDTGQYTLQTTSHSSGGMTGYQKYQLQFSGVAGTKSVTLPVNALDEPLAEPLRDWYSYGTEYEVKVDGQPYRVLRLQQHAYSQESPGEITVLPATWLVTNPDGTLVTDEETARKAAKTALVAHKISDEEAFEQFLSEEYPTGLRKVLERSYFLNFAIQVRDSSAELLGTMTNAYVTGGSGTALKEATGESAETAARMSGREAIKRTSKGMAKDVLTTMAREHAKNEIKKNTFGTYEASIRTTSHDQMRDAIDDSERAGEILESHPDGETWSYKEANKVWIAYNQSMVDGILWSRVRVETMPRGGPKEQLTAIGTNYATGATGAPVAKFAELMQSGEAGDGIESALRETAQYRQDIANDRLSYTDRREIVHKEARQTLGSDSILEEDTSTRGQATVEIVSGPDQEYVAGENVEAKVRVTNTGSNSERYFVGYSVATESDSGTLYFDNNGRTGHWITVAPDESRTTTVEWQAQQSAPVDQQYDVIVAVWPSFPSSDIRRYDGETTEDAFRLEDPVSISVSSIEPPTSATAGKPVPIDVTLRNDGQQNGSYPVAVSKNDQTTGGSIVNVPAKDTKETAVYATLTDPGTHELKVAGKPVSVTVQEATTQTATPVETPSIVDSENGETTEREATIDTRTTSEPQTAQSRPETEVGTKVSTERAPDEQTESSNGKTSDSSTVDSIVNIASDLFDSIERSLFGLALA